MRIFLLNILLFLSASSFAQEKYQLTTEVKDSIVTDNVLSKLFELPFTILGDVESVDFYKYALESYSKQDYVSALLYVRRAIQLSNNVDYRILKGWIEIKSGNSKGATKTLKDILKKQPENWKAIYCLANAYMASGNPLAANVEYTRVLEYKSDYFLAYYERGLLKFSLNDFESALQDFDLCLYFDKFYSPAYLARGKSYFRLFKYDNALIDLNRAIVAMPTNGEAYYFRGLTQLRKSDYSAACGDLSKAVSLGHTAAEKEFKTYCVQ